MRHTLQETLEIWLRLLHPFMPFISEEVWQTLPHSGDTIVIQPYPVPEAQWQNPEAEQTFRLLEQSASLVRTARALLNYPPGKPVHFFAVQDEEDTTTLEFIQKDLAHMGRGQVSIKPISEWPIDNILRLVAGGVTIGMTVEGDVDLKKALDRLLKQIAESDKESQRLEGKLKNAEFVSKAPPDVIADHQERLTSLSRDRLMLANSEQQLRAMLGT